MDNYDLTEEQREELEKLNQFDQDKELAIFDELKDINKTLKVIANKEDPEPNDPIINVEIPKIELPTINVPKIEVPKIPDVKVEVTTDKIEKGLEGIKVAVEDKPTVEKPLPVVLTFEGKEYKAEGGKGGGNVYGGGYSLTTEKSTSDIAAALADYAIVLDDVTTTSMTYVGKAPIGSATSGAVWQIKRLDESGSPNTLVIKYADGNSSFDNVWDNRASLTYN